MANTEPARVVPLNLEQRQCSLKHIALLWGLFPDAKYKGVIPALITEMQETDPQMKGALYYLAGIEKKKHALAFKQLSPEEQMNIIDAITRLRAAVSLFPERVSYIDCDPLPNKNE